MANPPRHFQELPDMSRLDRFLAILGIVARFVQAGVLLLVHWAKLPFTHLL